MKRIIAFAVFVLSASALSDTEQWENFKVEYGKVYKSSVEERNRFSVFLSNLKFINEHNAQYDQGLVSYTMGVNQFADMTLEEFKETLTFQTEENSSVDSSIHVPDVNTDIPDSIDWRQKGAVLPVKDQQRCMSCWAFSANGAIEGQNYIKNKISLSLSEQQLLDCSKSYGNGNCHIGGHMNNAFRYIKDHGLQSDSSYPYTGRDGKCKEDKNKYAVHVKDYKLVNDTEEALKQAVGTVGPICAAVYSDPLRFYKGGIFDNKSCESKRYLLDHAVLVVGYGEENGTPFWIIKNSYGITWGENGYLRLKRNADLCGLRLSTSYPVL